MAHTAQGGQGMMIRLFECFGGISTVVCPVDLKVGRSVTVRACVGEKAILLERHVLYREMMHILSLILELFQLLCNDRVGHAGKRQATLA